MLKYKSKLRYSIEFVILIVCKFYQFTKITFKIKFKIKFPFYFEVVTFAEYLPNLLDAKKLGFFCSDRNLNYPITKQTFTTFDLYLIIFIIPTVTVSF